MLPKEKKEKPMIHLEFNGGFLIRIYLHVSVDSIVQRGSPACASK